MRKLTLRERVLFVILIILTVISAYFLLFHIPNSKKIEALQNEIAQKHEVVLQCQEKVVKQEKMEKELKAFKTGEHARKPMPYYDNVKKIIIDLNQILATTNKYALDFSVKEEEGVVLERLVAIPFQCSSYQEVKNVLAQISSGNLPCFIQDLDIHKNKAGGIEAVANICYFEYKK